MCKVNRPTQHKKVIQVTINVIVEGDWVTPIDLNGNLIGKKVLTKDIVGSIKNDAVEWLVAIKRMQRQIEGGRLRCPNDPWESKIEAMKASFKSRKINEKNR